MFYLLNAIDNGLIELKYTAENGKVVDLGKDGRGELAGWYLGVESFREKYSGERLFKFVSDDESARRCATRFGTTGYRDSTGLR